MRSRLKLFAAALIGATGVAVFCLSVRADANGRSELKTPPKDAPIIGARDFPIHSPIDSFILTRLKDEKVEPAQSASDIEFLRRVYLDVIGVIPTGDEARAFFNDKQPDRRARLIDTLLKDERYADHWEVMWGDLLREHSQAKKKEGTVQGSYREWLRGQLGKNVPYDQFVRKLITASGSPVDNGAVNFFLRDMQSRVETVNAVAQVFMGTQLACAQCHDHPFDKWTQTDFHSMMAFFARTNVSKAGKKDGPEISIVSEKDSGEYKMPKDGDDANKKKPGAGGEVVPPVFPWDPSLKASGSGSRRDKLAAYVTGNRRFAAVQVNRLWSQLFGRGIVNPTDDFREKNPASHPDLLEHLTDEFIKAKFDNKAVLRLMLNSAAYQRSSLPTAENRGKPELYAYQRARRMSGEELFDSILIATGYHEGLKEMTGVARQEEKSANKAKGRGMKGLGDVEWAADLPTPAKTGTFMNTFNQPSRNVIEVSRAENGSITQALEMLNGKALNDAVRNSPLVKGLVARNLAPRQVIAELYLSTLSRTPTMNEVSTALKYADNSGDWAYDLTWALLNSREFTFVK